MTEHLEATEHLDVSGHLEATEHLHVTGRLEENPRLSKTGAQSQIGGHKLNRRIKTHAKLLNRANG